MHFLPRLISVKESVHAFSAKTNLCERVCAFSVSVKESVRALSAKTNLCERVS